METYEKSYIEILKENCEQNRTNTDELSWYYWRIHRLEAVVELLIKENAALKEIAGL